MITNIDPRVKEVMEAFSVRVVTFTDYVLHARPDYSELIATARYRGFYKRDIDLVVINTMLTHDQDASEVILHELIHATGHVSRLDRLWKFTAYADGMTGLIVHHTEEAIAQMGMFKLAMILGLDRPFHERGLLSYLPSFPCYDTETAERESDRAVSYLLGLMAVKGLKEAA